MLSEGRFRTQLLGALQVERGVGPGHEAHAALAEPPGRGHGGQAGGSVEVLGRDGDDGCAHVEDRGDDDLMRGWVFEGFECVGI